MTTCTHLLRRATPRAALLACLGALALACSSTQRLAGPLEPLPAGVVGTVVPPPGATEVTVLRQADGVRIQRPGMPAGFALTPARARARAVAGSVVRTAGPGRAELLWDGSPASVVLFGPGAMRIGNLNAGEPIVRLLLVDRARVQLGAGHSIALPGGGLLIGEVEEASGPFLLETAGVGSIQLINQSKRSARLRFDELDLELRAGARVELPATDAAGRTDPRAAQAAPLDRIQAGSLELGVRGPVRWTDENGGVRLEAAGDAEIHGLGLVLRLAAGESVLLAPLRETEE